MSQTLRQLRFVKVFEDDFTEAALQARIVREELLVHVVLFGRKVIS